MIRQFPGQLREFLLPYDPAVVASHLGRTGLLLPPIRCTEDRPRNGTHISGTIANTKNLIPLSAHKMPVPPRPSLAKAATAEGMIANAARTGMSVTGGLSGFMIGHTVGKLMHSTDSRLAVGHAADIMNTVRPFMGEDHDHCLGREMAGVILRFIVDNPEQTENAALQIAPWFDQNRFGPVVDAARDLLAHPNMLMPSDLALQQLQPTDTSGEPPAHAAEQVIAIGNISGPLLWDTAAAWNAGHPGYALNTGLLPLAYEPVCRLLGGDPKDATAAMLCYEAAATYLLPRPSGRPLDIFYDGPRNIPISPLAAPRA